MYTKLSLSEQVAALARCKELMAKADTKAEVLQILSSAGNMVGYAPAFRCLVKGYEPEASIRHG